MRDLARDSSLPAAMFAGACWAVVLGASALPVSNPDLFWHLSAARRIVDTGRIPGSDWLSWTMAGAPWRDFEWLSQLAFHGAQALLGSWGFVALKGGLLAASALIAWSTLGLYGIGPAGRGLGILAWVMGLSPANDIRPENFSLLLFAVEWRLLESRRLRLLDPAQAARPEPGTATLAAAACGFILWANLHPGFLVGLAILGVYAAAEAWRSGSRALARLGVLCAAATLVNPHGPKLYVVGWEHWIHLQDLRRYIVEWSEPRITSLWLAPFWGILAAAFGAVLSRILRPAGEGEHGPRGSFRGVPAEHLAALACLSLSAAGAARAAMYFVVAAVPAAACHMPADWGRWRRGRLAGFGLAALALGSLFAVKMAPELGRPILPGFLPEAEARLLEAERGVLSGKRLFHPWHWGGYLGWRLHPGYKVFVDGRYIFHPMLRPMHEARRTPEEYGAFLDGRGVEVAVIERGRQFVDMPVHASGGRALTLARPIYLHFLPRPSWALVSWSSRGMIFVRRSAAPPGWLAGREYRYVRPDDLAAAALMAREGLAGYSEIAAEVERFARQDPDAPEAEALREWLAGVRGAPGRT